MRCVPSGGLLRDGALGRQTATAAREVLAPKLAGALALGAAAAALPLAGSCLFSSVAALLGNAGQANYAAANGALDAVAASERAKVSKRIGKAMHASPHARSDEQTLWSQLHPQASEVLRASGSNPSTCSSCGGHTPCHGSL